MDGFTRVLQKRQSLQIITKMVSKTLKYDPEAFPITEGKALSLLGPRAPRPENLFDCDYFCDLDHGHRKPRFR